MFKSILAATAITIGTIGSATAATLSGSFFVEVSHVTNLNSAESQATLSNFNAARAGTLGGVDSTSTNDLFIYGGSLSFRVPGPQDASQRIDDWLDTGNGVVIGLDTTLGALQLSEANIDDGTAQTTFFLFRRLEPLAAGSFSINHDDGIAVFEDGNLIGGVLGPTSETTTVVNGYGGGVLSILYVATNGNPSVFEVDFTPVPVPLPASLPLLLAGVGGLAFLRRRARG